MPEIDSNPVAFFTATILEWKPLLKYDSHKDIIVDSFRFLVTNERAEIFAFVIMPNHIHLVWRINDKWNPSDVQRDFMKFTAQHIKYNLLKTNPELLKEFHVRAKDREYQFWKRNPLSVELVTQKVLEQKILYIHNNPVRERWNLATEPELYRYSSAKFYETGEDEFRFLKHYGEIE